MGGGESERQRREVLLPWMLQAFADHVQAVLRTPANPAASALSTVLGSDEPLLAFAQARDHGDRDSRLGLNKHSEVLLVASPWRLLVVAGMGLVEDHPWSTITGRFEEESWWGSKLLLDTPAGHRVFKQLIPFADGLHIADLINGASQAPDGRGLTPHPASPAISHFMDQASLYEDRLATSEGQVFPMSERVEASIDTAGNISVTRGRNLATKTVGGLLTGGLGFFAFGNASDHTHDTREHYLFIEGPDWAYTGLAAGEWGAHARHFAQAVNLVARLKAPPREPEVAADTSTIDALERLADLRDRGVLTDEQFAAQRDQILR